MPKIVPYTLRDAQRLVLESRTRLQAMRDLWDVLETVYATGDVDDASTTLPEQGQLWREMLRPHLDRVNLALPHINIIIASVSDQVPQFVVNPLLNGDSSEYEVERDAAAAAEDWLKFTWRHIRASEVIKDMTKDCVVLGSGFSKVTWAFSEEERDRDLEELAVDASLSSSETVPYVDEPVVDYVRPHDLLVPVNARNLHTARWVAQVVTKPVDEWRADLNLGAEVNIVTNPVAAYGLNNDLNQQQSDGRYGPFTLATAFEFYDQRSGKFMVFQEGSEKPWYEGNIPTRNRRAPFVQMRNYQRNALDFFGFGDLLNIVGPQAMLNEVFSLQVDNMRRSGTYMIADRRVVDSETKEALETPELGRVVTIEAGDRSISDVIQALQMPALPADLYNIEGSLNSYMAQILGLSDFQRGMSGADRMSGTAASAVEGNSSLRAADKQLAVSRSIQDIAALLLEAAAMYMSEPMIIKVAGSSGPYLREIAPDSLEGDFTVMVEAGSTAAVNPATRQQRAIEQANVLVPLAAQNGYDVEPLLRQVFRDFGVDPDTMLVKLAPQAAPGAEGAPVPPVSEGMPPVDPSMLAAGMAPQDMVGGMAAAANDAGSIAL